MDIYVGNLPFTATEEEVAQLFAAFGPVEKVKIVMDRETGRPRGFCFVTLADVSRAKEAAEAMDGQELGGRPLRVNPAEPRENKPGGFGGGGERRGGGGGGYGERRGGPVEAVVAAMEIAAARAAAVAKAATVVAAAAEVAAVMGVPKAAAAAAGIERKLDVNRVLSRPCPYHRGRGFFAGASVFRWVRNPPALGLAVDRGMPDAPKRPWHPLPSTSPA